MTEEKLRFGVEMSLSKKPKVPDEDFSGQAHVRYLPKFQQIAADPSQVHKPLSFEYVFRETGKEFQLTDEGLGQLYVCFGAPGQGKSYFLQRLLNQLASPQGWDMPWGGLLLDPKLTLIGDVKKVVPAEKLHVIGPSSVSKINLLSSHLKPNDLGTALALASQCAGISGSDPYWTNQMKVLFGAGLSLLSLTQKPLTLASLADLLLGTFLENGKRATRLSAAMARVQTEKLDEGDTRRMDRVLSVLTPFANSKGDNSETVKSFVGQALSPFLDPDLDYVSDNSSTDSVADLIFRDGKWVLLEVPRSMLTVSRMLSALVKVLFQRAVLERFTIYPGNQRRVFLFVDEYAEVASDLPGEGFGDSIFFSQMRQFRVLSLLATQGVSMLENSGVKEAWKTILSNSAGKIFFRVADPDTAELASKLLGQGDAVTTDQGINQSGGGTNLSMGQKLDQRTELNSDLFLGGLARGDLVFLGNTDGRSRSLAHFVRVK